MSTVASGTIQRMEVAMAEPVVRPRATKRAYTHVLTAEHKNENLLRQMITDIFGVRIDEVQSEKNLAMLMVQCGKILSGSATGTAKRVAQPSKEIAAIPEEYASFKVSATAFAKYDALGLQAASSKDTSTETATVANLYAVRRALRQAGGAYIFLRRLNSMTFRPSEMAADDDTAGLFDGPRFAKRRFPGFFGESVLRNGKTIKLKKNLNFKVNLPRRMLEHDFMIKVGAAGTEQDLLACFCHGLNTSAFRSLVRNGVLHGLPVAKKSLPVVIMGSFGTVTRMGSSGSGGITCETLTGVAVLPDTAETNLCNCGWQ